MVPPQTLKNGETGLAQELDCLKFTDSEETIFLNPKLSSTEDNNEKLRKRQKLSLFKCNFAEIDLHSEWRKVEVISDDCTSVRCFDDGHILKLSPICWLPSHHDKERN